MKYTTVTKHKGCKMYLVDESKLKDIEEEEKVFVRFIGTFRLYEGSVSNVVIDPSSEGATKQYNVKFDSEDADGEDEDEEDDITEKWKYYRHHLMTEEDERSPIPKDIHDLVKEKKVPSALDALLVGADDPMYAYDEEASNSSDEDEDDEAEDEEDSSAEDAPWLSDAAWHFIGPIDANKSNKSKFDKKDFRTWNLDDLRKQFTL
jgi:hypothetical protein